MFDGVPGPKYVKFWLNMTKFWISQILNIQAFCSVLNMSEYALTEFWINQNMPWQSFDYISGSKYVTILNMGEF